MAVIQALVFQTHLRRRINMFSRQHSTITKGILIILMLAHHVFSPDLVTLYEVKTLLHDPVLVTQIITFFKICVAGFSFISAFGITRALKNKNFQKSAGGHISYPEKTDKARIRRCHHLHSGCFL